MKRLVEIDFYVQSIFLGVIFLMSTVSPLFNQEGILITLSVVALWQFLCSLGMIGASGPYVRVRMGHIVLWLGSIGLPFAGFAMAIDESILVVSWLTVIIVLGAGCYYYSFKAFRLVNAQPKIEL
ncbi:MAG TPA: hypothetical protein VFE50_06775 [Cyclobacteriaceae bacterium]|nr:hypothetical protein [Cyclobacteriaceae bacterium]